MAWEAMVLLRLGTTVIFFSATCTIFSAVPIQKAAAGAIQGIAYEFGAGLGMAIFSLMVTTLYGSFIYHED